MRSSPTPSAPAATAAGTSSGREMLASTRTATPSRVTAGAAACSRAAAASRVCRSRRRPVAATASGGGATVTVPASPSRIERRPVGDREERGAGAGHCRQAEGAGEDGGV